MAAIIIYRNFVNIDGSQTKTMKNLYLITLLVILSNFVNGYPEPGRWHFVLDTNHTIAAVPKSLFKGSKIFVTVTCKSPSPDLQVRISWAITESVCWNEYLQLSYQTLSLLQLRQSQRNTTIPVFAPVKDYECNRPIIMDELVLNDGKDPPLSASKALPLLSVKTRAAPVDGEKPHLKAAETPIMTISEDGFYSLSLQIEPSLPPGEFSATIEVKMVGEDGGYLSASDWPLLHFYAVMCVVYVFFGVIWLCVSFCQWRDLLRIQFWIGGVIFLGMLEKATFYAEYHNINKTGTPVRGTVLAAEWVSCGKRTLARMLVIIVSLGFGIVKPRLGPMLHRVVGVGLCYFVLACTESYIRVMHPTNDPSNQLLIASIPLAAIDSIICWWIFTALVQTTRTLRLRRNMVKLSLYRHFTNTLIFAVFSSVVFMLYTIKAHRFAECLTDWKELWVDDAFWHVLFSIILLVIMVLWRPTNNNQRYAFTPLLDNPEDDDEEDHFVNDSYGVKMRTTQSRPTSPKPKTSNEDEDILRWVDDNVPSAGVETALPLLDSDEEIQTTRFEVSKML